MRHKDPNGVNNYAYFDGLGRLDSVVNPDGTRTDIYRGWCTPATCVAAGKLKAEKRTGMRVHGRTGEKCPVCGDTIREVSYSDSSLQYCPTCQTGGKPLADRRLSRLLK